MELGRIAAELMGKLMVERMLEEPAEPGSSFKLSNCLMVKPWAMAMAMDDRPIERIV